MLLGEGADRHEPPASLDGPRLVEQALLQRRSLGAIARPHVNVPVVVTAGLDLTVLAFLAPLALEILLRLGARQRHGGVFPCRLDRMPARRANLRGETLGARQLPHDSGRLVRLVLRCRVQEQLRAIPGDNHLPSETLPRRVVEVERSQPFTQ